MISRLAVAIPLVALTLSQPAWAQSEGRITGVVRDATGAVIPGATVTATNQTTKRFKDRNDGKRRQLFGLRNAGYILSGRLG